MGLFGYLSLFVKRRIARTSYGVLRRVPLPAEYKWRGTEELFAAAMHAILRSMHEEGAVYAGTLGKVMEEVGRTWMEGRSEWVAESPAPVEAAAELLDIAFKTMDMVTSVRVYGNTIEAITWRCPFVQHAHTNAAARESCHQLCGAHQSLFTGFAGGLPLHVRYDAPGKMGFGDAQCVKRLTVGAPGSSPMP